MPTRTPAAVRILAIEDDQLLASPLQAHLQSQGFNVTLCHDGHEGLRLAATAKFDLILMDILLPDMSGLETLQQLRKHCCVRAATLRPRLSESQICSARNHQYRHPV